MRPGRLAIAPIVAIALLCIGASSPAMSMSPPTSSDTLLAQDRDFASAGADGFFEQFADEVIMPVPGKGFAKGKQAVVEAFKAQAGFDASRIKWTPFGAGVSADGRQGYTFGFMDAGKANGESEPLKYLAYWQRTGSHWRVIAYKHGRRAEGPHAKPPGPVLLPNSAAWSDSVEVARVDLAQGLATAEREFSDRAQEIGLGPAFAEFGTRDSMNLGGPGHADFVFGAVDIAKLVSAGQPQGGSTLSWAADERVVVSDTGDLGLSVGFIRHNAKAEDGSERPPIPFFTIWRRAAPDQPWRYIAE